MYNPSSRPQQFSYVFYCFVWGEYIIQTTAIKNEIEFLLQTIWNREIHIMRYFGSLVVRNIEGLNVGFAEQPKK